MAISMVLRKAECERMYLGEDQGIGTSQLASGGVLMLGQPRWTSLDGLRVSTTACQYMPQVRLQELAIYLMPR
jgi:hypothetical protein